MPSLWKILLALGLVLPLGAFVVGSLIASAADDPAPRDTIIIEDAGAPSGTPSPLAPTPTTEPSDDTDDTGSDDDGDDRDDDAEVVTPGPDDMHDHADDDGRDGDGHEHRRGDDND